MTRPTPAPSPPGTRRRRLWWLAMPPVGLLALASAVMLYALPALILPMGFVFLFLWACRTGARVALLAALSVTPLVAALRLLGFAPELLPLGWLAYLVRTLPLVAVSPRPIVLAAVNLVLLFIGTHLLARWLAGARAPTPAGAPRAWGVGSTASVVASLGVLFGAGIASIGAVHQVSWILWRDPVRYGDRDSSRTMAGLRALGTAVEAYRLDTGRLPAVASGEVAGLVPVLVPTYLHEVPEEDGWGHALYWMADGARDSYSIVSLGKDKVAAPALLPDPASLRLPDLYYSGGRFTIYPCIAAYCVEGQDGVRTWPPRRP